MLLFGSGFCNSYHAKNESAMLIDKLKQFLRLRAFNCVEPVKKDWNSHVWHQVRFCLISSIYIFTIHVVWTSEDLIKRNRKLFLFIPLHLPTCMCVDVVFILEGMPKSWLGLIQNITASAIFQYHSNSYCWQIPFKLVRYCNMCQIHFYYQTGPIF